MTDLSQRLWMHAEHREANHDPDVQSLVEDLREASRSLAPPGADELPEVTSHPHAARFLAWLREVFAERREWLPRELELAAARDAIDWGLWYNSRPAIDAGLRTVDREVYPGMVTRVYVLERETGTTRDPEADL